MSDQVEELKGCAGDGPGFRHIADGEGRIRVGLFFWNWDSDLTALSSKCCAPRTTTQSLLAFSLPGARRYVGIL